MKRHDPWRPTRREVLSLAVGLGLASGASGVNAQAASPVASPAGAMTPEEVARAIAAEGTLTVANWAYQAAGQIVEEFQRYVRARHGVDVTLDYRTAPNPPEEYALLKAIGPSGPAPYDVMAIEEKFWAMAMAEAEPLPQPILPSPLTPNALRVDERLRHFPTAVAFQSSSTIGIIYNRATVEPIQDWTDLAEPRLKGQLALPSPDNSYVAPMLFVGLAYALGMDYRQLDQMHAVIDFVAGKIAPNAASFVDDVESLYLGGEAAVVIADTGTARNWQERGRIEATFVVARSGQPMINGYLWIPRGAAHPVLAQIFIDWRLSDDGQLPGSAWRLDHKAWLQYHEGLLGPSYAAAIPDWLASDAGQKWWAANAYADRYPSLAQLHDRFRAVDWTAHNRDVDDWLSYYAKRLGR